MSPTRLGRQNANGKRTPDQEQATEAEQIYKLYPRKVGKRAALKAINSAIQRLCESRECAISETAAFLKERTSGFAQSPAGQRGQYTPFPATWFNADRFMDDASEWQHEEAKEISKSDQRLQRDLAAIRGD